MFHLINSVTDPFFLRCAAFGTIVFVLVLVGVFAHYPYKE